MASLRTAISAASMLLVVHASARDLTLLNISSLQAKLLQDTFGAASPNEDPANWVAAANLMVSGLLELSKFAVPGRVMNVTVSNMWSTSHNSAADELKRLLDQYHSDKANVHNYHHFYAAILQSLGRHRPLRTLEIGLGTNTSNHVGSMASTWSSGLGNDQGQKFAKPGASLRAFRDFLPSASVFGADLDSAVLFHEERIDTAWADQLDPSSLEAAHQHFGNQDYDLIIDDGLHAVAANLNTLNFALRHLRPGGYVVIEDIGPRQQSQWRLVDILLSRATSVEAHGMVGGGKSGHGMKLCALPSIELGTSCRLNIVLLHADKFDLPLRRLGSNEAQSTSSS